MFTSSQLWQYARVLFWGMQKARRTPFESGDIVLVRSDFAALPLAEKVQNLLLEYGLNPVVRFNLPGSLELGYFSFASDEQLAFSVPGEGELYSRLSGLISLLAPDSITHLKDVLPGKIAAYSLARKYLHDILDRRENARKFGWTLCLMPTAALAQNAGMSEEAYAEQILRAAYLDQEDPVNAWEEVFMKADAVKTWLNGMDVDYYRVRSNNVDLRIYPGARRRWVGITGHNIPSFELFLSPDFHRTEGHFYADQPSYRNGNLVQGVALDFYQGEARVAGAEQGGDFVRAQLRMDEGSCRLGEFSLTDKRFSRINVFMAHTLFDENFGGEYGNCHVALGASYADSYAGDPVELTDESRKRLGFNDSALHWDLVNTEPKSVTATLRDGSEALIYENGMFTLTF